MTNDDILEALGNMGYGEEQRKDISVIAAKFRKRKCALYPNELDISDLVSCTLVYDFFCSAKAKVSDEKGKNGE